MNVVGLFYFLIHELCCDILYTGVFFIRSGLIGMSAFFFNSFRVLLYCSFYLFWNFVVGSFFFSSVHWLLSINWMFFFYICVFVHYYNSMPLSALVFTFSFIFVFRFFKILFSLLWDSFIDLFVSFILMISCCTRCLTCSVGWVCMASAINSYAVCTLCWVGWFFHHWGLFLLGFQFSLCVFFY